MTADPVPTSRAPDRRVQRSRAALMAAAVRLVSERGTTNLPVTDLAEAAGVSRQLVYLQFGDRDTLLIAAAVDLVRRELVPEVEDDQQDDRTRVLATTRHFARHRSFYRAMVTGSCAFAVTRTVIASVGPLRGRAVHELFGAVPPAVGADLAVFVAGGVAAMMNEWLLDDSEPVDPERMADRLLRVAAVLSASWQPPSERAGPAQPENGVRQPALREGRAR